MVIEMEASKINFKYVYKIKKIELDRVTFEKYNIKRDSSLIDNKDVIELNSILGEETHTASPEVISQIAGKVGEIIKSFEVNLKGKKYKKVLVTNIVFLE